SPDGPEPETRTSAVPDSAPGAVDRTPKLYIGGKQKRPDGGYSRTVTGRSGAVLGEVAEANRKDVRDAVEAARKAAGWSAATPHLRAQILYYLAENLDARRTEIAARLNAQTETDGEAEVEGAVRRLFTYAAWTDKYDGRVQVPPLGHPGLALALSEPVGVVGVLAPAEAPLLGLVSLAAPLIAMGNRVVLAVSEDAPLVAQDLYQALDTSDVPAGVLNLLTGDHAALAKTMGEHLDIDAVWCFGDAAEAVERASSGNMKRTFTGLAKRIDWFSAAAEGRPFLREATRVKTVWIPYGA
ncbi:MAG: aldehyde dehydrogenase family protein, partial [Pseudomonadota bacterium]